jgi:quinol monooxygenase YgiN
MNFVPDTNLVSITIFTPKPADFGAFLDVQLENLPRLGQLAESLGAQFYAARDGNRAILVSHFRDGAHLEGFQRTEAFLAHRDRLRPMLESAETSLYNLVYVRDPQPA